MDQFDEEAVGATIRANERLARDPRAVAARYEDGQIVIDLSTRYRVSFSPERAQGLAGAKPSDLAEIEITPSGYGLHWPRLDADLWLPALLEGVFGSRAWMAARLGAEGGKATSDAKAAAARENGALGGRPRKAKAVGRKPARAKASKTRKTIKAIKVRIKAATATKAKHTHKLHSKASSKKLLAHGKPVVARTHTHLRHRAAPKRHPHTKARA
jgi:hypothetical protein